MAVKKFILSFGQSNGGPSPEYVLWIQKHPELDLRLVLDPANKYTKSAYGSYSDQFTMPGTFAGYTTLNLFGRAIRGIRYLTHYNPLGAGTATFPCTSRVMTGSTSTALYAHMYVPNSTASGANTFTIVRQSNGASYTVSSTQYRFQNVSIGTNGTVTAANHNLVVGDKFRFQNVGGNTVINNSTDYYVVGIGAGTFTFSATQGGAAFTTLVAHTTVIELQWVSGAGTRLNLSTAWANPAVDEQFAFPIKSTVAVNSGSGTPHECTFNVLCGVYWIGTYVGCRIKATSGVNNGQVRTITGVDATGAIISYDNHFDNNIQIGDTFEIVAPTGAFNKWAYFLPWSPFEGLTEYTKLNEPPNLRNNYNPYPPGFSYPNHWHIPVEHDPRASTYGLTSNGISYHVGLAAAIQNAIADDLYVIASDFGGSSLAHNEQAAGVGLYGWHDPKQQSSWAPGEPNNCFARLMDELDTAIAAAAVEGNTLECIGCFFIQGETDSVYPAMADRYGYNLRVFKKRIRQELKDRGLWAGEASKIPWVQPKISTVYANWVYAETVNACIEAEAKADRYMRTFDADDIPLKAYPDDMHYNGYGAVILEQRCYNAWQSIRYAQQEQAQGILDICNLALSHIGEDANITSIDPPDGSTQAALCAQFYPIARDSILEMQTWAFATKRAALLEATNSSTEWDYAYALPNDALTVISVLPPDAADDYSTRYNAVDYTVTTAVVAAGMYNPQPYSLETDENGNQIILTDQADAVIRYTARITDTTKFSPLFITTLSWQLASMLAGPIIKSEEGATIAERCVKMMYVNLAKANTSDASQRNIKPEHIVSWMAGR